MLSMYYDIYIYNIYIIIIIINRSSPSFL